MAQGSGQTSCSARDQRSWSPRPPSATVEMRESVWGCRSSGGPRGTTKKAHRAFAPSEHQENGRQDVIVGMVGTRFAGLDGVSLEADKLATVLEEEGHQVVWFAGELGDRFRPGLLHPPAHFGHPAIRSLEAELFGTRPPTPAAIRSLRDRTGELKTALRWFLRDFEVDVLIVQNALCLPMNVPLGVALAELLAETGVPAVAHHHDFAWERERFRRPQMPDMLRVAFPPALPGLWHVVI